MNTAEKLQFDAREGNVGNSMDVMKALKERQHEMLLQGREVVDLSMVNPDLPPPRPVLDRLLEYVTKTSTHKYAVSRGVRRLREAFSEKYKKFGVALNPESEVCVCLGSKDATYHALRALVTPGDAVIVAAPAYPAHLSAAHLVGAAPVLWEPEEKREDAAASLDALLRATNAKLLVLNLPNNPTGRSVSADWLHAVVAVARRRNAYVINDFVYGEMCFDGSLPPSLLSVVENGLTGVLEVYSLSKAYNVPGWRIGALSGDSEIVRAVARQKSVADYGAFLPLQYAAALALTSPDNLVRGTVSQYERRIRVLTKGLRAAGWVVSDPRAGASVWASYPRALAERAVSSSFEGIKGRALGDVTHEPESVKVARFLLEELGILTTPGVVFGEPFDGFVRFAAVVPDERLREVVEAIGGLS